MKGFTLIELLIVIAILVTLAVIGGLNLFNYYRRQNLELTVNEITALIRDAQNRSLSQQDGNQWGLRFENATQDSIKIFYATSTLTSTYVLRAGVQFTDPGEDNSQDIVFKKITGLPLTSSTIKIALKGNSAVSSTITINENGVIQY